MTRNNTARIQPQQSTSHPLSSGILQRKCTSCGQHTIAGEKCEDCLQKRSANQTAAAYPSQSTEVNFQLLQESRLPSDLTQIPIQAKLRMGQPNDQYEQEADRVAAHVMRMPEPSLQRQTDEPEEDDISIQRKPLVQRQFSGTDSNREVPSIVHDVLRSPGQPLDSDIRNFMEPRFGYDLSGVRIHADAHANQSATAINASAYTVGQHLVFGADQYAPRSRRGRQLIAHELTHSVQQNGAPKSIDRNLPLKGSNNAGEQEAAQTVPSQTSWKPGLSIREQRSKKPKNKPNIPKAIQRQLVTPLAPGGGFQGLMERDRQRAALPSTAAPTPQIDVRSKPATVVGLLGFQHLFIVETNASGNQYFYRGGPGNRCSGAIGPFHGIKTDHGRYVPSTIDWSPGAPSVTVATGSATRGKRACFLGQLARIHSRCIPYSATGPNSNTVVRMLLGGCSLPIRSPVSPWRTPGF